MNENAIESLTKLASELTDRVEALENENKALRAEAQQVKKASENVVNAPKISEKLVEDTISLMLKAGALEQSQAEAGKQKLLSDPDAPCRVLCSIIDAQLQAKQAAVAAQDAEDVAGGRLMNAEAPAKTPQEACLERMEHLLGRY